MVRHHRGNNDKHELTVPVKATLPNLRRLFIEARTDDEEREVSRKAFYNAVLFMSSVAVFSLIAQRMNAAK
ncbi:hypothetical protein CTA2_4334 [Colletotrichum tanaceti]|uniref:Transmembrane protein n=1 Tax=Colletotrichum tanaceti TaxID=1306861 RepID=A0A4U6XSR4_9PEZI|nr:hypothetical protein CTA2_4333 [Colletotrichum tanaceti]KAJ0168573.1 hypothetical protein CTA2_4334 [Colletotrichum tanaceti]TKW58944.1 hypothetical protein CTA1_1655 [Colletotrichum tanaceti]